MERYSVITEKNPREIVLLRGSGCKWKRCTFCDYHLDSSSSEEENFKLNSEVLSKVTGIYQSLEVINSGSYCELDNKTMNLVLETCIKNNIQNLWFECHFMYKNQAVKVKEFFKNHGISLKIKTGVETFDADYREKKMKKGFGKATPQQIAEYADEVCLLFGLPGQTELSMKNDIETGLKYFERVCINIMNENSTAVAPDYSVVKIFSEKIEPDYRCSNRVDILMDNLEFGVGTKVQEVLK